MDELGASKLWWIGVAAIVYLAATLICYPKEKRAEWFKSEEGTWIVSIVAVFLFFMICAFLFTSRR